MPDEFKPLPKRERGPQPLPIETVRDLLGITRAMYAAQKRRGNHGVALRLKQAGQKLRRALMLAVRDGDAAARAEAWLLADEAISEIGREQMNAREDLGRVIQETAKRIRVHQHGPDDREAKRADRIKRG